MRGGDFVQALGQNACRKNKSINNCLRLSDANFKKEIAEIKNPLDKIDSINAYQYKFNFTDDDKLRYGVLAQNLKEQGLDDLVFEEENSGRLSVDYNNLVGLLSSTIFL